MLEDVDSKSKVILAEQCEFYMRRLNRKLNFLTKSIYVCGLKAHLAEEQGEHFPLIEVP